MELGSRATSSYLKKICEWLCKPFQHKLDFSPQFLRLKFMSISETIQLQDKVLGSTVKSVLDFLHVELFAF